ncbi:class I SAM-dependent methyltransferase [Bacillus sp. Bva_UNVM-123]|uniref:class I SAM-dependent methyltransferase n=1 Tax=Bacillus sp. Bva_UNVM-123 TaxID=2829798 RepID=UPI00391F80CE
MNRFNWIEEAEKQWDERSSSWNSKSQEMWETGSRKEIIPYFSKYIHTGSVVCDVGCGDGYGSFKLAKLGYKVMGVDISEEMIHKAELVNSETNAKFKKGDIAELPFSSNLFDAALAINSLEWTEKPLKVLKEMQRVVKPCGFACIGILGPTAGPRTNSYHRLYDEKVICNTMMPWEFARLASENNWKIIDGKGVYKRGVDGMPIGSLSIELRQSLSFMWLFILRNDKQERVND